MKKKKKMSRRRKEKDNFWKEWRIRLRNINERKKLISTGRKLKQEKKRIKLRQEGRYDHKISKMKKKKKKEEKRKQQQGRREKDKIRKERRMSNK